MKKHAVAVIISACLWGFMGLFRRYIGDAGVSSAGVIMVRCGLAALMFGLTLLATDVKQFLVKPKDLWCFIGSGIVSLLFFTFCYFQAMSLMSLSAAAILLYIAPSVVMLLSLIIFKEKLNAPKLIALVLAFLGCALVSGLGAGKMSFTALGLLYGLCAGVGYALYSIFARLALDRGYSSNTINFYSCLLAAAGAAIIWGPAETVGIMFSSWSNLLLCVLCAFITCYLPYLLYTYGLTGIEPGRASIMASVEPVVATLVGFFLFHEKMTLLSALGVLLVLSSVVILNLKNKKADVQL
ncbi:MAG: EamA family transporter [Oscillospiraceae bacterium]